MHSLNLIGRTHRRFLLSLLLGVCVIAIPTIACSFPAGSASSNTPAATATPNPIIYKDALDGSTKSQWTNDSNCSFGSDGYHIKASYICYSPAGQVGDAVFTVTATQVSGPTTYAYGLVFRRPSAGNYYEFLIDSNSKWLFDKVQGGNTTHLVDFTSNSAIKGGLNQLNTLSVQAQGSHFVFSVNGTQVGTFDDTTFTTGDTGLAGNDGIDVAYTSLNISKISA